MLFGSEAQAVNVNADSTIRPFRSLDIIGHLSGTVFMKQYNSHANRTNAHI